MNAIVPFDFEQTPVRIEDREGEPWFVLSDVCRVLGIANVGDAAARLDLDERDDIALTDAIGRQQAHLAVNEAGFYRLVLRSRKPAAQRLTRWVTHDVLPSLRRNGSYGQTAALPPLPRDPRELLAYLATQAGDMVALQDANAALAPKAEAFDRIADARGALNPTEAAKVLKIARKDLYRLLMTERWAFKSKRSARWTGYRDREIAGLVEHRVSRIPGHDDPDRVTHSLLITPKGLTKLAAILQAREDQR